MSPSTPCATEHPAQGAAALSPPLEVKPPMRLPPPCPPARPGARPRARRLLPALALLLALTGAAAADDVPDYSPAERALFMTDHLRNVSPPATLRYRFHKAGTLEPGFDDAVTIVLSAQADGGCCNARGEFLSGTRRIELPEVEGARGNPAILYFLEHDVREMQRLTKGQSSHFRKRIRMAIYNAAQARETGFEFEGRTVRGREISIAPYLDDPNRGRFAQHAGKEYVFMLSDDVPGGVFGIRTRSAPAAGGEALIVEEMFIEGARPPSDARPTTAKAS